MYSNCTVERIIFDNVDDSNMKFILMILSVLVGLKLRKRCEKSKANESGTVSLQSV